AELVAAMDQINLARIPSEEIRLFYGGVSAADDGHDLLLEERRIADRAVRYSLAGIFQLAGNPELDGSSTSGHDDGGRAKDVPAFGLGVEIPVGHLGHRRHAGRLEELGTELLRMGGELFRQLITEDLREADHVIEILGVEELPTGKAAFEHGGAEHRTTGIKRRG